MEVLRAVCGGIPHFLEGLENLEKFESSVFCLRPGEGRFLEDRKMGVIISKELAL